MRGAMRVQRKTARPSQLELIFTHTAGILLCMVWVVVSGLKEDTEGKVQFSKTNSHALIFILRYFFPHMAHG